MQSRGSRGGGNGLEGLMGGNHGRMRDSECAPTSLCRQEVHRWLESGRELRAARKNRSILLARRTSSIQQQQQQQYQQGTPTHGQHFPSIDANGVHEQHWHSDTRHLVTISTERRLMKASQTIASWRKSAKDGLLRFRLQAVMQGLEDIIDILNDKTFDQRILDRIVSSIKSLGIIGNCDCDKPDSSLLKSLQLWLWSRRASGPLNLVSRIERINYGINQTILEAVQYIRSLDPEMRTDSRLTPTRTSRLTPNDLFISEHQERICASFDQWHKGLNGLMDDSSNDTRQLLSKCDIDMRYRMAKICISACHYRDESVYDWFKDLFKEVVTFAKTILDSCPEALEPTNSKFDFYESSYLSLLEFVIFKCRWLDIRYEAWLTLKTLAEREVKPADLHGVQIKEVTLDDARLFSLPPEELRVKNYTIDAQFAVLATAQIFDREGLKIPYIQRLMLRCASCDLEQLAMWVEGTTFSPSETRFIIPSTETRIPTTPINPADSRPPSNLSTSTSSRPPNFVNGRSKYSVESCDFVRTMTLNVRQQKRDSVVKELLDTHPERAITYSWVTKERKEQCQTLAKSKQTQLDNAMHLRNRRAWDDAG
ncbi:hypothetical protein CSUB01_03184 [Colletotrichum sublineola]|uniref:Uncharacterized protein n=1 Tax=Colletotrichum sublineola TaxID=1173701 RepID=A0A066X816_COLSU|nr:hypothetical protein CSUB01_03184 [Colletotrichum sublineola]